ncbi:MAG: XisI protein [Anaerolineaceae bacterium]|nr:XisI protein [Anaerolineaceae bacterium]
MDTQLTYQHFIKEVLNGYAQYKPAYGDIESRVAFDDEHGSYALLQVGWQGDEYVHGAIVHIDLIGDKVWIQYDGTEGIAADLVDAGIPKEAIVLGFRPPALRVHTGFAVG